MGKAMYSLKRLLGRVGAQPPQGQMRSCESLRTVSKPLPCHPAQIPKPCLGNESPLRFSHLCIKPNLPTEKSLLYWPTGHEPISSGRRLGSIKSQSIFNSQPTDPAPFSPTTINFNFARNLTSTRRLHSAQPADLDAPPGCRGVLDRFRPVPFWWLDWLVQRPSPLKFLPFCTALLLNTSYPMMLLVLAIRYSDPHPPPRSSRGC